MLLNANFQSPNPTFVVYNQVYGYIQNDYQKPNKIIKRLPCYTRNTNINNNSVSIW